MGFKYFKQCICEILFCSEISDGEKRLQEVRIRVLRVFFFVLLMVDCYYCVEQYDTLIAPLHHIALIIMFGAV